MVPSPDAYRACFRSPRVPVHDEAPGYVTGTAVPEIRSGSLL